MGSQLRVTGRNGAGAAGFSPGPGPGGHRDLLRRLAGRTLIPAAERGPFDGWAWPDSLCRTPPIPRRPTAASDTRCWGTGAGTPSGSSPALPGLGGRSGRFPEPIVLSPCVPPTACTAADRSTHPVWVRPVTGRTSGAAHRCLSSPARVDHRTDRETTVGSSRVGRCSQPWPHTLAGTGQSSRRFRTAVGDREAWLACPQYRAQPRPGQQGRFGNGADRPQKSLPARCGPRSGSACPWVWRPSCGTGRDRPPAG